MVANWRNGRVEVVVPNLDGRQDVLCVFEDQLLATGNSQLPARSSQFAARSSQFAVSRYFRISLAMRCPMVAYAPSR